MKYTPNGVLERLLLLAFVTASLAACGGGGSKKKPPPPPSTYSVGGSVSGLVGSLVLQNNGGDDLTINADGVFSFATELGSNIAYAVSILTQPAGEFCEVSLGAGTVMNSNVGSVSIECRPANPVLAINGWEVKILNFTWGDVTGETEYRLLEDLTGSSGFSLRGTLGPDSEQAAIEIFVPDHVDALYMVQACYSGGCIDSNVVAASGALNDAVGYVKALVPDPDDHFGTLVTDIAAPVGSQQSSVSLSADGTTLAIGVPGDDSGGSGIGVDASDNSAADSGSVYVLNRVVPGGWILQAYIKASNAEAGDAFGAAVALSSDGSTLAISALTEDSAASGVNGDATDNSAAGSGAAYVFVRDGAGTWSQQAYIKASNTEAGDAFGLSLDLSGDGQSLVVAAVREDGGSTGVNGVESDNSLSNSGAAYVFEQDGGGNWSQQAYLKSSNPAVLDNFGWKVAIDGAGDRLVVSAKDEDSGSAGINADQLDNSESSSGAVYVFDRDGTGLWSQQAYLKASNPGAHDIFGWGMALADDGLTLAVGAPNEDSGATGIDGAQFDESFQFSGATYIFTDDGAGNWSQQAYIKASNTNISDIFGTRVELSDDGSALAVGARFEGSDAVGIGGDQFNNSAPYSGAVYLFYRDGVGAWSQNRYIKSPNSEAYDSFGSGLSLSGDGRTLAAGASGEDSVSSAGGDRSDNSATDAGAVYIY